MNTKTRNMIALFDRLRDLGFTLEEAAALRRIEMTLHRWAEHECGDSNDKYSTCLERDEETGKPFWCVYWHDENKVRKTPCADREKGALKRLQAIMANHPDLAYYHQGDPRGCALYIVRKSDLSGGLSIDSCYTRGIAVAA